MAARTPLVLGPDGLPQQLQASDTLAGAASAADIWTGTDNTRFLTAKSFADALKPTPLVDAATVVVNMATGIIFTLLFTAAIGNTRALGTPTGMIVGYTYRFVFTEDATGGRGVTFPAGFLFGDAGSMPITGANKRAVLIATCLDATAGSPLFDCSWAKGY